MCSGTPKNGSSSSPPYFLLGSSVRFLPRFRLPSPNTPAGTGIAFLIYTSAELPRNIGLASSWYALSALLNLSVTSLIVGRLLASRRRVINSVPLADTKLYSGTISILVESALPFCLVSIAAAALTLPCLESPAMAGTANYITTLWVALSVSLLF